MTINKLLTTVNFNNTNNVGRIKYIVIHYVGALGGAKANCEYFKSVNRNSSAHYFVGHEGEVWQCVEDADVAWHCGAKKYKHASCRNSNSIGIEMCVRKNSNGVWYFEDATVASTIELTKELMAKYNIPIGNVIRHYDVTGKTCPEPYVRNENEWKAFKNALTVSTPVKENTTVSQFPTCPFTVNVIINDLNYRSEPSMKGIVKGQTGKGTFTITEVKNGWGQLKSGVGWILIENPSYCTIGSSVKAEQPTAAAPTKYLVKVTADALNIRSGPGTAYGVVGCIRDKGTYTIVQETGNWGKLLSGAGWISLKYTKRV